jgi:tetratricopeptide (TPR) repeat protein
MGLVAVMVDIDKLRQKAVRDLSSRECEVLFRWLLANGFQREYEQKLAESRSIERRAAVPTDPGSRALLIKPVSESDVTAHGTPMRLQIETFDDSTQTSTANSFNRESSTVQLTTPDHEFELPPTQEHLISDLVSGRISEFEVDPSRAQTGPSFRLSDREITGDSASAMSGERQETAQIERPRHEPRRIEFEDSELSEREEPPPLPAGALSPTPAFEPNGSRHETALNQLSVGVSNRSRITDGSIQSPKFTWSDRAPEDGRTERKTSTWWLATLCGFILISAFLGGREYTRLTKQHTQKMQEVERLFRTGNYDDLKASLAVLQSQEIEFGVASILLNGVLPVLGQTPLSDRFIRRELKAELRLRSTLTFVFRDDGGTSVLSSLIDEAVQRNISSTDIRLARALLRVSTRALNADSSEVLDLKVGNGHSEWVQAVLHESMGNLEVAEKYIRSAMSLDFEHPYAGLTLAGILARRGDGAGALKALDQILVTRPGFVLGRLESARLGMRQAQRRRFAQQELESLHSDRSLAPSERSLVAILLADEEIRTGQLAAAELRLSRVMDSGMQQEGVVRRLASVYFKQSKLQKVERLLSKEFWLPDETKLELWSELFLMMGLPDESLDRLNRLTVKTRKSEILLNEALALKLLIEHGSSDAKTKRLRVAGRGKARLEVAKGSAEKEPALILIESLVREDIKRPFAIARQQLMLGQQVSVNRLISWRFVVAWGWLENGELSRGVRLLSSSKRMSSLTGAEQWLKCEIESRRLKLSAAKSACQASLKLSSFEPARSLLSDILEARDNSGGVIELLTQSSKRTQLLTDDAYRLARAYYAVGDRAGLVRLGQQKGNLSKEGVTLLARGLNEVLEGKVEDGLSRLRRVVSLRSKDARTLTLLGRVFAGAKRPREAQRLFESAMSVSEEPYQRIGLAQLLLEHGRIKQALGVARSGEKLAQSSLSQSGIRANAVALQARAYMQMKGRANLRRSKALLKKARRINRDTAAVSIAWGLYYEKTGEKQKAKDEYRQLIERNENSLEAQYRLGRILLSQKRTKREGRAVLESLSRAATQTIWSEKARGLLP